MAEAFDEHTEWVKLPVDLQRGFFELATREAEELFKTIKRIDENLKSLRAEITPYIRAFPPQTKKSTIAAVDSSRSPRLSERLGIKYGVYATGVVYLKGGVRTEKFKPGVFRCRQALTRENSKYLFDLLTIQEERRMALEALKECDILLLDGSFYSFVYPALKIREGKRLKKEEMEILNDIFNITEELRKSGRALGIIKRSRLRALGGYLLKHGDGTFVNILDKHILSLIMPERSFFEYSSILGNCHPVIYTNVARLATIKIRFEDLLNKTVKDSFESLFEIAENGVYKLFKDLGLSKDGFMSMRRAQVRFYGDLPPCELEYPNTMKLDDVLSEDGLFSEATNLPLALDLVDNLVNISSKFTEEFVSEIEGRVLENMARCDESLASIKAFFAFLNPQKPF